MSSFSVLLKHGNLPDADVAPWALDGEPSTALRACAGTAVRTARAVSSPMVRLYRAHPIGEPVWLVSSWVASREEAEAWIRPGREVIVSDVPLPRILAVIHFPGDDVTEYVVATRAGAEREPVVKSDPSGNAVAHSPRRTNHEH